MARQAILSPRTDRKQITMKRIIIIASIAMAVAIAGCGGSGLPKDDTGAPQLSAVATSIGCTGLRPESQPTMFASAEGTCTLNDHKVDLATFASRQLRDNWEKIGKVMVPLVKDGPGWAAFRL
jgi:hypothetical protein